MNTVRLFVSISLIIQCSSAQSTNYIISENLNDQGETTIALYPCNSNRVVAGWNEGTKVGFAFSSNGGVTWSEGIISIPNTIVHAHDPSVAYDKQGYAYFCCFNTQNNHVFLLKTTDSTGLATWSGVQVRSGDLDDKPMMCVNNSGVSGKDGRVYVAWVD